MLTFSDEEKVKYSKYILRILLPFLKQFHAEQLAEKKMEAKIQGIFVILGVNDFCFYFLTESLFSMGFILYR